MATDVTFLAVLRHLEATAGTALVRFHDGDSYVVRVISTMHAEAGDDIVAKVLKCIANSTGVTIPTGAFMNFVIADVSQIEVGEESTFVRTQDSEPGTAAISGA